MSLRQASPAAQASRSLSPVTRAPAGGAERDVDNAPAPPGSSSASGPRRPSASTPFHPPSDTSTYRDLLLFEERLKMNAEMLRRRRRRYNVFLWSFIAAFVLMAYRLVMLPPESLLLLRILQAAVTVVFITLALFFASGMHEEKIRYAHAYISHSNKALRPLNMYFNVRRAPSSLLSYLPFLPSVLQPAPAPLKAQVVPGKRAPNSSRRVSSSSSSTHGSHTVMAQIPPSTNPRGELIFSSRVDHHFEEGYKRYRAAFERRREERAREKAAAARPWWLRCWWRAEPAPEPVRTERVGSHGSAPSISAGNSRRGTPEPGSARGSVATGSGGIGLSPPASPSRRRMNASPPPQQGAGQETRERAESYSFVYNGPGEAVSARAGK